MQYTQLNFTTFKYILQNFARNPHRICQKKGACFSGQLINTTFRKCVCVSELWSLCITLCQCLMHPDTHTSILISLSAQERQRESIVGFSRENWGSIVGLNRRCSDPWEFFNPHTKWLSLAYEREGGKVSLWTVCKDPSPPSSPVSEHWPAGTHMALYGNVPP